MRPVFLIFNLMLCTVIPDQKTSFIAGIQFELIEKMILCCQKIAYTVYNFVNLMIPYLTNFHDREGRVGSIDAR